MRIIAGVLVFLHCLKLPCGAAIEAPWTVRIFMNGVNGPEPDAIDNFMQLSSVGSTPEVNFIVEVGRLGHDARYGLPPMTVSVAHPTPASSTPITRQTQATSALKPAQKATADAASSAAAALAQPTAAQAGPAIASIDVRNFLAAEPPKLQCHDPRPDQDRNFTVPSASPRWSTQLHYPQ